MAASDPSGAKSTLGSAAMCRARSWVAVTGNTGSATFAAGDCLKRWMLCAVVLHNDQPSVEIGSGCDEGRGRRAGRSIPTSARDDRSMRADRKGRLDRQVARSQYDARTIGADHTNSGELRADARLDLLNTRDQVTGRCGAAGDNEDDGSCKDDDGALRLG